MGFKDLVERDAKSVFTNSAEFGEVTEFWYGGNRYRAPVVMDYTGTKERQKANISDHAEGITLADVTMYVSHADVKAVPRRGAELEIGEDTYLIQKVEVEGGMIALHLEMLTE